MDYKKQVYVAPRLKEIYATPRLTEHGSVARLTLQTASTLPPGINGALGFPPAAAARPFVQLSEPTKDLLAGNGQLLEKQPENQPTEPAEGQATQQTVDTPPPPPEPPPEYQVKPGDSLWSIAEEQLGPNATPEQTMDEVERIYELNRELIGDDPNLLIPGQELSLAQRTEPAADASATEFPTTTTTTTAEEPATAKRPEPKDEPAPEQINGWAYSRLTLLLSFGLFLFALAVALLGVWKLLGTRRLLKERYKRYYGTSGRLRYPEERKMVEGYRYPANRDFPSDRGDTGKAPDPQQSEEGGSAQR